MSMMEEGVEAFPDAADFLIQEQRRTEARALTSLSDSPDDAARADQISRASGENPAIVFPNLKEREEQYKAQLTSQLLNSNSFLRGYVEAHPLADKVSNDDYGQLDAVSEAAVKLPGYRKYAYNLATGIEQGIGLSAEGLGYILGVKGTAGARERMHKKTLEDVSASPEQAKEFQASEKEIGGMVASGIGGLIGLAPSILAGGLPVAAVQMGLQGGAEARNRAAAIGVDEQTQATAFTAGFAINSILGIAPLHLLTRPAQATGPGVVNWSLAKLKDAGISAGIFTGFGELQHGFNEWAANLLYDQKAAYHPDFNRIVSTFILGGFLGAGFNRVKPWVEAGEEIPPGADRTVDHVKAKQAEIDIDNLDEALKQASKSATRERSPELFKIFMRQHTDAKIGVSADAIVKMYGDEIPVADDGKLGWVPNIKEQLTVARETGGDVEIPLADWLAHVDPAVAKELHDDIRVRPRGLTINEGTALEAVPMVEAFHGTPHEFDAFSMEKIGTGEGAQSYGHGLYFAENKAVSDNYRTAGRAGRRWEVIEIVDRNGEAIQSVREQAGLEPLAQAGDLTLKKRSQFSTGGVEYDLISRRGHRVGSTVLRYDENTKDVHVNWIGGGSESGTSSWAVNAFGPSTIRDLLRQVKAEFPEAETISGNRVSGARGKVVDETGEFLSDVKISLKQPDNVVETSLRKLWSDEQIEKAATALEGRVEEHGPQLKAVVPEGELTRPEMDAVARANEVLERILPEVTKIPARLISFEGRGVQGVFQQYTDRIPTILYLMDPKKAVHTVRHEAIHFLRREGFFTKDEWDTLRHTALKEGWIEHYDIGKRYQGEDLQRMLEEAVAERYADWADGNKVGKPEVDRILGKLKDFAIRLVQTIKEALPHNESVESLFQKIESGEIGRREGTKPLDKKAYSAAQEEKPAKLRLTPAERKYIEEGLKDDLLDEVPSAKLTEHGLEFSPSEVGFLANWIDMGRVLRDRGQRLPPSFYKTTELLNRIEGGPESYKIEGRPQEMEPGAEAAQRDLFAKANAIGMTIPQYERYMRLIKKRGEEDARKQMERAEAFERKKQTKEWKEAEDRIREEITNDIKFRPDIAVATFFTEGRLYDTVKNQRPRLDANAIPPELANRLPKELLLKRGGINPDDIAPLFGYQTGLEMVSKLVEMNEARGEMKFAEFIKGIVDEEVSIRMLREHGMLEENILKAAQEHVIGETQMDILHEEFIGLGMKSKLLDTPFTKDQIKTWIAERFDQLSASGVSIDKFLREAGKAGRDAEMKLLANKVTDAFQHKQRQYIAMLLAGEAKRLEREQDRFGKTAKKFSARKVEGVEQSYTDYVQALLSLAGLRVRRSDKEIAESIEAFGTGSLEKFVERKSNEGWELAVSENVQQNRVKPFEEMTVAEFREFKEAIDSLVHVGREEKKIIVGEEKRNFEEVKQEIIDNITQLPERDKKHPTRWLYLLDASLVKMEEVAKDLDLRKQAGPMFKALILPLMKSKRKEYDMLQRLSEELLEIKGFAKPWKKTLSDTIPNDFLIDPRGNVPFDLTRENMVNIMLNFGNKSNIQKFTEGYAGKKRAAILEARLWQMFDQYATKEDWQFVQKIWDLFETWRGESDAMYRRVSGVPPKWIEVQPITTRHGEFKGGYFPIIYDKLRSNVAVIEDRAVPATSTFGADYFKATTGAGYAKARTGYVDYVQFENSIEQVAGRMQQMIHDISHREAVMSVGKIIYNRQIRASMREHYGPEYEAQLHPWLRDIANHYNANEQAIGFWNSLFRRARFNLVAHALGLNIRVIGSPNLGMFNPVQAAKFYSDYSMNSQIAYTKSNEIPHTLRSLDRDFREKLEATINRKGWSGVQAEAFRISMWPALQLEQQARMIGFVTKYKRGLRKGLSEADAIAEADNAVRSYHGAAGTIDLPAVMRGNEALKVATVFYGFFNTIYNWQRQIPGNVRRGDFAEAFKNLYGSVLIPAAFGALLFNQAQESDSWFKTVGKALLLQPLSTIPILREGASYFMEGFPPRSPIESIMNAAGSIISDVKKYREGKPIKKPIQHAANVVGLGLGLPLAQIGRSFQFGYDVGTGKQRLTPFSQKPVKNIQEWVRGIISGEAKLKP